MLVRYGSNVSVLFNEPKLLKSTTSARSHPRRVGFSALQRAEIAEIRRRRDVSVCRVRFSALQRAEIAEISRLRKRDIRLRPGFSALQRAEIAEIVVLVS